MADRPVSRIEWVEDKLRQALFSGELEPGERLLTAQLSERFQVSPTPLREALHRLAGEGLVEFVPQRGARVAELSPADSAELTELRSLLEPACVARAVERGDEAWRSELDRASKHLRSCWRRRPHDPAASEQAYRGFYLALTSACDSTRLKRYARAVRDQDARYRLVAITGLDRRTLDKGHRLIVSAALGGDSAAAASAVRAEIETFSFGYRTHSGEGEMA